MSVKRNGKVDLLRGIAMLMVVLGHTMTGCTTGAENTLLFNVIWSIQMPLFFLISGYVTKYSAIPKNGKELRKQLEKKTLAYLLPWGIWTFLIRGQLLGQHTLLDISYLLWHMDTGYWFLFSLWTITMIYTLAQYVSCGHMRRWCAWGDSPWVDLR